jgi:hypothetical protein
MSGETDEKYEMRVRDTARQDTIYRTMLTLGWLFLMKALVNGERVRGLIAQENLSLLQQELEKRDFQKLGGRRKNLEPALEDETEAYPGEAEEPALEEELETPPEGIEKQKEVGAAVSGSEEQKDTEADSVPIEGIRVTPEQEAAYKAGLMSPDISPQSFDLTVKGWLYRISNWGKLDITHFDPEKRGKRTITQKELERILTDAELTKILGTWDFEPLALNKIQLFRDYVGIDGKKHREKVLIVIDLRPELKPALKAGRWWWPF